MSATPATTFDDTFASVADVEGWMTEAQARHLWDHARRRDAGDLVVEIGSYQGLSLIMMATAAADGVEIVSIDPHWGNDTGPQIIEGSVDEGERQHRRYRANLERAGVWDRIRYVRRASQEATDEVDRPVDLLYIDGAHRYEPARSDIVNWGDLVADDGIMLIHDSFSSKGVTRALAAELFFTSRWKYVGRTTSLAEYHRTDLSGIARVGNASRQLAQLPWFALNLFRKFLIAVKIRPRTTIPY